MGDCEERKLSIILLDWKILEIGCRSHGECSTQKACINGICSDPCSVSSPCQQPNQECQVKDHQPVCIQGKNLDKCLDNFFSFRFLHSMLRG